MVKKIINQIIGLTGHEIRKKIPVDVALSDLSVVEKEAVLAGQPFTMTSLERMASLANSVSYVADNKIEGDFVECGVWRGGSMMIVAKLLLAKGDTSRTLYLYDTFEGMSEPTDMDLSFDGASAESQLASTPNRGGCLV